MTEPAKMAELTETRLVLDAPTGEMVSRNELRKRDLKRKKKAAKAASKATPPTKRNTEETDPDAIYKHGFLADVYNEKPVVPVTRFPPEPNGYLHIGHAKSIVVNFGFAKFHGGSTILRFDDTNPDAEEAIYFEEIEKTIAWLGFKPDRVTYSSDNFDKLFELAVKLITLGKAYVCLCSKEEQNLQRGGSDGKAGPRYRCEHAERSVKDNLEMFNAMKEGKYEPGMAVLRMKMDIESPNPQMWDLAAYRVKKEKHVRRPEWCIFPTYDFTHSLCDALEGVTHSLCTTEFVMSRESYDWLNGVLGMEGPMQREFGRLRLSGAVTSKRVLKKLVEDGSVRGWDDPRLYTLCGIRRRGIPAEAVLAFINELGVSTAWSEILVSKFEASVRKYLEHRTPRLMMVLDPLEVVIEDLVEPMDLCVTLGKDERKVTLTKTVFVEKSDWRDEDEEGYYRLAPGKVVGLMGAPHPVRVVGWTKDKIRVVFEKEEKPRTYIHWVGEGGEKVEARVCDEEGEKVYAALVEGMEERFQAVRVGYFAVDKDSVEGRVIVNRIVALRDGR